ncbi:hypothetical protein [Xanthovirga aplysinae]|uniref:hypothetical protein n=1 Tax=Xanthovirga aplysinae TaxID=2529853 RepID=UPI0012BB54A7|nr:hypothetical protein [Xanthovirga aplysinae]MTI29737.1 hypothetical protein [Xanthovirga aplysinae]
MSHLQRTCMHCNRPLVGRADRKFCSTACRTAHHNQLHPNKDVEIQKIIKILKKNRKLLKYFSPNGKTTIRRSTLSDLGYDFRYFTHVYKPQSSNPYYLCFDYGIMVISNEKCLIVNYQPYMEEKFWSPYP